MRRKQMQIVSLGLAAALLFSMPARADVQIIPLEAFNNQTENRVEPRQSKGSEGQTGTAQQAGPGQQTGSVQQTGPEQQTVSDQQAGPGGQTGSALLPTAAYTTTDKETASTAEPVISAEAGILYDVTRNRVVFEKNADEKLYPASITKLLTALLVVENAAFTDQVRFSKTAVTGLESGAVTLNVSEGDVLSVKDCLYGLLLKSANEVANGLAEHLSGSVSAFADKMNRKAAELGCTGTHFANPSGLNSTEHYTTCRDMAKIAAAAFSREEICKIASTLSYPFPAIKKSAVRTITPGHKMLYPNDSRYYKGIIGGKTGYTSRAGNTLVTCVEQDGIRMIAVILKASGTHYADTKAMLDYGYQKAASDAGKTPGNRWIRDGESWRYELADGSRLSDCLVTIDGEEYGFDAAGKMLTGWQKNGENWYYFESNGALVKNDWRQDEDRWFYLGVDGAMQKEGLK